MDYPIREFEIGYNQFVLQKEIKLKNNTNKEKLKKIFESQHEFEFEFLYHSIMSQKAIFQIPLTNIIFEELQPLINLIYDKKQKETISFELNTDENNNLTLKYTWDFAYEFNGRLREAKESITNILKIGWTKKEREKIKLSTIQPSQLTKEQKLKFLDTVILTRKKFLDLVKKV